jgi:histone deacetylase 1/2
MASNGKIYISKDVVFNEQEFPFSSLCLDQSDCHSTKSQSSYSSHIPTLNVSSPNVLTESPPTLESVSPPTTPTTGLIDSPPSTPVTLPTTPLSLPAPVDEPVTPRPSSPLPHAPPVPKSVNAHPMVTRGKTGNLKPKVFLAHSEPSSVKQALADP